MKAQKSEKLLTIFLFSDHENIANFLIKLLSQNNFKNYLEKYFIMIGLIEASPDIQKLILEFPPAKAIPCFLFININILEKISFIGCLPIDLEKNDLFYLDKFKENFTSFQTQKKYELKIKQEVVTKNEIKRKKNFMPAPGLFWNPFYDPMTDNLYSQGGDSYNYDGNSNINTYSNYPNRELIEKQNQDYQRLVDQSNRQFDEKIKKEKESKEKEEKERKKEINLKEKAEALELRKLELIQKVGEEDPEGDGIITFLFRFPEGKKMTRRFKNTKFIKVK